MKKLSCLLSFFALFLLTTTRADAQNKVGINIGDHFNDFDKAANIVGSGGWVVVMTCPGDADKIAKMAADHPEINIVIRGHYPGQYPPEENNKLAKLWVASLQSIPFPNKVYFMPWNEPNHDNECGDHACSVEEVKKYVSDLKQKLSAAGLLNNKVILLSPMIDKLNPRFEEFKSIYSLTNASSINEYDQFSPGPCSATAVANNCLYDQIGIPAPYFAPEAGVAGTCGNEPPCYKDSELRQMLERSWQKWGGDSNFKMFAIFSYDPHRADWDIFSNGSQTIDFLKRIRSADGCCTQRIAPSSTTPTLKQCPGKIHSFYIDSESECGECGSMITVCKPIKESDQYGEETSKESINIPEQAKYSLRNDQCLTANFNGKIQLTNFSIPFANNLNKYFLGPFVDNLKARVSKKEKDPFKDSGVLEKLLPKDFQDDLKLKFIAEVESRGAKSRYQGFRIEGKDLNSIAGSFRAIREKEEKGIPLSSTEQEFLNTIWLQVPLFANEESEGEVDFWGSGIEAEKNKLKTSVPEVYRLNKATELLEKILTSSQGETKAENTSLNNFQANACQETNSVPPETNQKESKGGPGDNICTKDELQTKENTFEGTRTIVNDATQACSENAGGCYWDGDDPSTVENRCCGNKGKCVRKLDADLIPYFECQEASSPFGCPGGCWLGNGNYPDCCVPDYREKTRDFTDTNLNSKNRVPYLNLIAQNTVGKSGFFRIFIPFLADQTEGDIKQAFREVAGESKTNLTIEINKPVAFNGNSFKIENVSAPLTLLFHKLGSMINVKDFISGKLLWPSK